MRKIVIGLLVLFLLQVASLAQDVNGPASSEEEKKPSTPDEFRTRAEIDRAEERQRKLVSTAGELNKLAQELARATVKKNQLSGDEQKKLGKIEKLAKQVRSEQGGSDDVDLDDPPQTLDAAFERLQEATDVIEKELSKLTRHGVSVRLIERTNEVIAITKTIKKMASK